MKEKILGGTSLEYNSDAGPLKYLVGTEQGYVLLANKKKNVDIQQKYGIEGGKHHGPVYALQRNPQHYKYFMSVGDWSAKIWSDENIFPIMQTRYHSSYLTDGCWSPTRCGLFYLTRIDGFLDVWDFHYRQNEVAYSQKISDSPLTSIRVNQNMAAIGDAEGTVSIMQLCRPLYETSSKEKDDMLQIFEREAKREKNLQVMRRLNNEKPGGKKDKNPEQIAKEKEAKQKEELGLLEEKFFEKVADEHYDVATIKARGDMLKAEDDA
jgi:dynein intermediate chain 2